MEDMGDAYKTIYFQQKVAPGEFLYDEANLKKLYEADIINTQYIHSIFFEEYEKNLLEAVLQKKICNGSVPSMIEKTKSDLINKKC